jgi:hypothetical protein
MTVNLASRISAFLLAATIVAASWAPTLHTPGTANSAPVTATR